MLQFRIRSLLLVLFAASVFFGVAQTAGYGVAAGIVVAMGLVWWAARSRWRGRLMYLRIGAAVLAVTAIWFLAIDRSAFCGHCPDCDYCKNSAQYRVLCIPVRIQDWTFPSKQQQILEDLGVPCRHTKYEHEHRSRFWGLVYHTRPCRNDLFLLGDYPHDYTEAMAARLRQWGSDNPRQAALLHDLIIRQHKYPAFWKAIYDLTADDGMEDSE